MNGIDPKWVFYLGILVTIEQGIGQGSVKLTNVIPDTWAPYVVGWCTLLAFIGNIIMTALAAYSSKQAGPLVKPAVMILVVAGGLLAFTGEAHAQTPRPRPALTGDIVKDIAAAAGQSASSSSSGIKVTGNPLQDLLGALDTKLLPDLKYAKALADATGSKVTGPCYAAWITVIETRQTAAKNADGTPMDMPDPHIVTDFEKMVELRNMLQPDSDFTIKCSPVATMVKQDLAGLIGVVISGGAGLAKLIPVL